MQLRDHLVRLSEQSESYFRRALAKEDLERVDKLVALARTAADKGAYLKEGRFIGWTQNDMTTYRLTEEIDALLEAVYALQIADTPTPALNETVAQAWERFHTARLEKLIHCL